MRARCLVAALTWLCAWGCGGAEPEQVSLPWQDGLSTNLRTSNPAWPQACERPPAERVGLTAPLQLDPPHRPVSLALSADLSRAIAELHEPFAQLFQRHVCAVVLMHGAPMTGTLTAIDDLDAKGLILLNVDNLTPPGDDWLALKESTVFAPADGRVLRGTMARPDEQPRRVLLEFLLVHELAHLLDVLYPDDPLIGAIQSVSWPRHDALAKQPLIHYPSRLNKAPLPDELLEPYYDLIASGTFTSPAAISNPTEDFADSVSTFMHTQQRGRPYRLDVYRKGLLVRQLGTCWEEARCARKRQLLQRLLARWRKE